MSTCNKTSFTSEKEADAHIKRIHSKAKSKHRMPTRSYYCNKCGLWHLTSKKHKLQEKVEELELIITDLRNRINILESDKVKLKEFNVLQREELKQIIINNSAQNKKALITQIINLEEKNKRLKEENKKLVSKMHKIKPELLTH